MSALFGKLFGSKAGGFERAQLDRHAEQGFKILADNSCDVIIRVRPDGKIVYVSPSSYRLLGYTPEEFAETNRFANVHPDDRAIYANASARARLRAEEEIRISVRFLKPDASYIWVECVARAIRDPQTGEPGDIVVIVRDISEIKALEDQLQELASTDGLTGLANRRAFDEALDREWRRTLRDSATLSLLLIDVDHFKAFNDHYGHQVGDDCLRTIAAALKKAIKRPSDMVARYGGEEIVVILANTTAPGATEVARNLCAEVESLKIAHAGHPHGNSFVTVSIGTATAVARVGGTIDMPAGLLQAADTALYKAKNNGRNRVESALLLAPAEDRFAAIRRI